MEVACLAICSDVILNNHTIKTDKFSTQVFKPTSSLEQNAACAIKCIYLTHYHLPDYMKSLPISAWCESFFVEFHHLYSSPNITRMIQRRMKKWKGGCTTYERCKHGIQTLVGKLEGKRSLWRPRLTRLGTTAGTGPFRQNTFFNYLEYHL